MIKAFENYEIWWVTGAQLLYGGDAVVAVDGHSKEMVAGLNDSGIIPIKVVYKGTANSSKEVEAVMKAANNDDKCVGIITWMHKVRRYHHLDAYLLSCQDVDQGSAGSAEAPSPLPHAV